MRCGRPLLPGNSRRTRGDGLTLCQGRFRLAVRNNSFSQRAVRQWHSCPGSGGVTVPGGVQEPWGCGTEGHAQWAWWDELGLGISVVFSNLNDPFISAHFRVREHLQVTQRSQIWATSLSGRVSSSVSAAAKPSVQNILHSAAVRLGWRDALTLGWAASALSGAGYAHRGAGKSLLAWPCLERQGAIPRCQEEGAPGWVTLV